MLLTVVQGQRGLYGINVLLCFSKGEYIKKFLNKKQALSQTFTSFKKKGHPLKIRICIS